MKICPMCGADILGADTGTKCSSCGGDLTASGRAGDRDAGEHGGRQSFDTASDRPLDDSAPIKPAEDLELVQSGHAFWTEPETGKKEDTDPMRQTDPERSPERKPDSKEETTESQRQVFVFEADKPHGHAPSLADLARARREQLAGLKSTNEEPTERPVPSEDTDQRAETESEKTATGREDPDFDDTEPSGVGAKMQPGEPAPVPGVKVVTRSADIAFIENNRLVIPGVTWSTGETIVLSGRTYQLKRKLPKYPVSGREMLIGTGAFLFGLLFAWMVTAGGDAPDGRVYGLVQDTQSGKLLPGVTIALEDKNRNVQSDPGGMFYIDKLEGGIYTFVASDPIYGSTRKEVTVAGGATSVTLELTRQRPLEPVAPSRQASRPAAAPDRRAETAAQEPPAATRGKLAVTASVSNAKIYIDGKLLGVGNAVYTGIRPGTRTIAVKYDGFQTWEQKVKVTAGETSRIEPKLTAVSKPKPTRLTPEQYAAQGRRFIESRNYEAALEQFNAAVKEEKRPQYLAWRAEAYVGLKDAHRAEADYLEAIYLFRNSGEDSRLEQLMERAVLAVPGSAALWSARGDYLYSRRKLRDAEKSYHRALSLGADPVATYRSLGLTHYAGGSFEKALESWTQADELAGQNDTHVAGYIALVTARLQYRASCRDAVRRVVRDPDILRQFRAHPDWSRVQHLTGEG